MDYGTGERRILDMLSGGFWDRDKVDSRAATSGLWDRKRWIVGRLPDSEVPEPTHA